MERVKRKLVLENGDVYVGDAVDYQQQGVVYRLNDSGRCLDTLRVGITPTAFCFR